MMHARRYNTIDDGEAKLNDFLPVAYSVEVLSARIKHTKFCGVIKCNFSNE